MRERAASASGDSATASGADVPVPITRVPSLPVPGNSAVQAPWSDVGGLSPSQPPILPPHIRFRGSPIRPRLVRPGLSYARCCRPSACGGAARTRQFPPRCGAFLPGPRHAPELLYNAPAASLRSELRLLQNVREDSSVPMRRPVGIRRDTANGTGHARVQGRSASSRRPDRLTASHTAAGWPEGRPDTVTSAPAIELSFRDRDAQDAFWLPNGFGFTRPTSPRNSDADAVRAGPPNAMPSLTTSS
jgi:hypothetical protein